MIIQQHIDFARIRAIKCQEPNNEHYLYINLKYISNHVDKII